MMPAIAVFLLGCTPQATVENSALQRARAPWAVDDVFALDEGSAAVLPVGDNDVGQDQALDLRTVRITQPPLFGTALVFGDGLVDYRHDGSEGVVDSFEYTVGDASGAVSEPAAVALTIRAVNDPPVAADDTVLLVEGGSATVDLAGNDHDLDDGLDRATLAIVTPPAHGVLVVNDDGTVEYVHDGTETPSDQFVYAISDRAGASSEPAVVTVEVQTVDDVPVAFDDLVALTGGLSTPIDVMANDYDEEGLDIGSVELIDLPSHGTVGLGPGGTVQYQPLGAGSFDQFTYTVTDQAGQVSNVAEVSVWSEPAVIVGSEVDLGLTRTLEPNVLIGNRIELADPMTVTHMGFISRSLIGFGLLALYKEEDGVPGGLVAQVDVALGVWPGRVELPIDHTLVGAGEYWLLAVTDREVEVGYTDDTDASVASRALTFADPFPDPFGAATIECCEAFNFYLIGY